MTKKRRISIVSILGIIMILLIGRLAYIQLLGHEELGNAAAAQQLISLEGANTRGLIYDRNHTPLIGNNQEYIFIIKKEKFDKNSRGMLEAMGAEELGGSNRIYRVYTSKDYDKALGDRLVQEYDAYILEAGRRYSDWQPAVHLLGYVSQKEKKGVSGLELMYDEELSLYEKQIFTTADVVGTMLLGKGPVVVSSGDKDSYIRKGITTTLELGLQNAVETVMAEEQIQGAAVVLDSKTGEILAAASTPVFNPNKIRDYMESNGSEFVNKVVQGEYPPGSVFKIAVAAAALKMGISPQETFICQGYTEVNGKRVACNTGGEEGHGTISLHDAFAQSCNSAFVQLGQRIGAKAIIDMAKTLGLSQLTLDGYPGEKAGRIMTSQEAAGAAISNLSIGQGETLTTPIQVARMTNIIAADGIDRGVHLIQNNEEKEEKEVLPLSIIRPLQAMMKETMETGTGKNLNTDIETAGKTGSAEMISDKNQTVHGWITGYAPAEEPEYTITVFVENGGSGSGSAGPVFEKIAGYLSRTGSFQRSVQF